MVNIDKIILTKGIKAGMDSSGQQEYILFGFSINNLRFRITTEIDDIHGESVADADKRQLGAIALLLEKSAAALRAFPDLPLEAQPYDTSAQAARRLAAFEGRYSAIDDALVDRMET